MSESAMSRMTASGLSRSMRGTASAPRSAMATRMSSSSRTAAMPEATTASSSTSTTVRIGASGEATTLRFALFEPGVERGRTDVQSPACFAHISINRIYCLLDVISDHLIQRLNVPLFHRPVTPPRVRRHRTSLENDVLSLHLGIAGNDEGALQHIAQLAHIAGPRVIHQF